MSFSSLFIRRSVTTTLIMVAILVFGYRGYKSLPVSDLPNVDFPTLQVTANLPGASPDTMASAVALPLERQFSTIAGITSMSSTSSLGVTQITLQFDLSRNLDAAALDVQAAISAASRQLPPEMPDPPTFQKVNPADRPILYLGLTSPDLPLSTIDEYGETLLAQRISTVNGVAQVQVFGSQKYAVRVQVDPAALAGRGIGLDQVSSAVAAANVNLPTGTIWGRYRATTIEATGRLAKGADFDKVILAYRNGSPVRLADVGRGLDSVENDKVAAWLNDQRAIVLAIQRQPGSNTIAVSKAVQAVLPKLRTEIPASVSLEVLYDRAESIEASVNDVKVTLLITLGLVVLVIFLFLRSVTATVIPSLALPLSTIGTFAVMHTLGYSLDNLSLMALTLSVGFVVDDAIVMLENIVRHVEAGESPRDAAFRGAGEIGFTIISMTLSLAAVFIPVLLMGGIIGRLFHEFAVTIGVAILISGFISLTLTPLLSSRLLRPKGSERRRGRLYAASERGFDWMLRMYEHGLRWSLRHRGIILLVSAATLVVTVLLFRRVPKGLFATEDTGQVFAATETAQGTSFDDMVRHQRAVAKIIASDPDVDAVMSSAGARGAQGSNTGVVFARLKPRSHRSRTADDIIQSLRPKLVQVPGIRTYLQVPQPIQLGGMLTKSQYQITLQAADLGALYSAAQALEGRLRGLPGLQDVTSDVQLENPQVRVVVDRDQAAALGVSVRAIEEALSSAYASQEISTIYAANNTYQVILELVPEARRDPQALAGLYVSSSTGRLVPLGAVTRLEDGKGPLTVSHLGQMPAATVSFNLRPGTALGDALAAVRREAAQVVPPQVTSSFQGTAQVFVSSLSGMGWLLLLAIAVIYLVLGILYESFIHPLTILSALPFAGVGALLTLVVFHQQLTIYAFVGVIMLVGLVKKNGIMMIDFALDAERGGAPPEEAIYQACVVRFRPIMMTTMAALMGTLPIAIGWGAGSESRRPLGLAVVGGLLFSQLLTLFVTPVFFLVLDAAARRVRRIRLRRHAAPTGAAILILLLSGGAARAEQRPVLTLDQALRTALLRQPDLRRAHAETAAAEARAAEARAPLLPQLSATGTYLRTTANFVPRPGFLPSSATTAITTRSSNLDFFDAYQAGANASLLLWDFGRTAAEFRAARSLAEAQSEDERAAVLDLELRVRTAFFLARGAHALVGVAEETVGNRERHLKQVQGFVDVGIRPPIDLARARTDLANARLALVRARNAYENAKASLNQAMGVEGSTAYDLADETLAAVAGEDASLETLVAEAVRARPELASLAHQRHAQRATVDVAERGWLPSVSGVAAATLGGEDPSDLVWNLNAGVTVTWNLFDGGATQARTAEARANLRAVEAQTDIERQQVRVEVDQARLDVSAAVAALDAAREAETNARELLRLAESRYETGTGSSVEISDAQVDFAQSEAQRVRAEYDLASARARLLQALGRHR